MPDRYLHGGIPEEEESFTNTRKFINNFELIKPLLNFSDPDKFYFIQLLRRKKDNENDNSNSRNIKNYFINTLEYLEGKMPEIIGLCDFFNARAYIRLNRRSYKKVAFKTLIKLATIIDNEQYVHVQKANLSAAGEGHSEGKDKTWIIDIDGEVPDLDKLIFTIQNTQPEGRKVLAKIPTKNGVHLISKPFNLEHFSRSGYVLDIHKDNPTILYCKD